jgi:hypothetical protein
MLGYADDITILISRKFLNMIPVILREVFGMGQQCCDRTQLFVNPQKMVVVRIIRNKDLRGRMEPSLSEQILQPAYSGQGIDMEGIAENVIRGTGLSERVRAHLVKCAV